MEIQPEGRLSYHPAGADPGPDPSVNTTIITIPSLIASQLWNRAKHSPELLAKYSKGLQFKQDGVRLSVHAVELTWQMAIRRLESPRHGRVQVIQYQNNFI